MTAQTQENADVIEHFGVKGMKWGVRKASSARDSAIKSVKEKRAVSKQFKMASKLTAGEVVASALVAGPIGVLGYKAIKRRAAVKKMKNRNLSAEQQTDAAKKIGIGEALAVTVVSSPVGLITYAAAKTAAAHQVEDF